MKSNSSPQKSLVEEAQEILSPVVSSLSRENKDRLDQILEEFSKLEREEKLRKNQININQNPKNWLDLKNKVNEINKKLSKAYYAQVIFDSDQKTENQILASVQFSIRDSSEQGRHVTPVAIIEKIILNALRVDDDVNFLSVSLLERMDTLSMTANHKSQEDINVCYEYFKNKNPMNESDTSLMIRIVAHLYNQKQSLTFSDDNLITPTHLHERYIIPVLLHGAKLRIHQGEGRFVSGLRDILDKLESQIQKNGTVENKEVLFYTVYALFDYLPLTRNKKNPGDILPLKKDEKIRHHGENLERLQEVAAMHLYYIFEAYPKIMEKYITETINRFLTYVANGVSADNLCNVIGCENNKKELMNELNQNLESKNQIRNLNNFVVKGFSSQYGEAGDFLKSLKENVVRILITNKPYYKDYIDYKSLSRSSNSDSYTPDTIGTAKTITMGINESNKPYYSKFLNEGYTTLSESSNSDSSYPGVNSTSTTTTTTTTKTTNVTKPSDIHEKKEMKERRNEQSSMKNLEMSVRRSERKKTKNDMSNQEEIKPSDNKKDKTDKKEHNSSFKKY